MTNVLIAIGLVLLFICGVILTSYAIISIHYDSFSIKNVLLLLIGVIMLVLWVYLIKRVNNSNHLIETERSISTSPTEIVTSIPPQIDTTITIRSSGDVDTVYTYIFKK